MCLKYYAAFVTSILLLFAGCGEINYTLVSQTPEDLSGFLGFRWTAPGYVIVSRMAEIQNVRPIRHLNDFYNNSYTNVPFIGRKANLCRFNFDDIGLRYVKLVFKPADSVIYSELDYFRDSLSSIYGKPAQMTGHAYKEEYVNYVEGYYWFGGRLTLTLMPGSVIIIRAYRYWDIPPDIPPGGYRRVYY